jgi:hypothetical protein
MAFNQQQVEKDGVYEAKSPLASLLSDLDQISNMAQVFVAKRKARARTGGYTMLGGLIAAVVGGVFAPLLVLGCLAIATGLFLWISSFFMGGKCAENPYRVDVARQRIGMIQKDAAAKTPFTFKLALAGNAKVLSSQAWTARKNGKQQMKEDSWLSLEGSLLDGTVVCDEIKDLIRVRTYSNPRGKSKSKSRRTILVNSRFYYPKEVYGDARPASQALHGEVKVGSHASVRDVRVTEKAIVLKALVTSDKEIVPTVGMLSLGAFRILNLARRIAAGQRGNAK